MYDLKASKNFKLEYEHVHSFKTVESTVELGLRQKSCLQHQ